VSTTPKTDPLTTDGWIEKAFRAGSQAELSDVYRQWADDYDADMLATGYLHVPVVTGLIARHVPRVDAAILDAGVGTGALGGVLSVLGYNNMTGLDMSEPMLAKALARKVYAELKQGVLGETLDFVDGSFDCIISTGTFTTGHAPASAFDELTRVLDRGGYLIFTVGTTVWEEQGFQRKLQGLVDARKLIAVDTTVIYRPMPFSKTESSFTTRAHVYRRV
jgi:SAM-dependent methyltransferase